MSPQKESTPEHDSSSHKDLYDRINKTERQVQRLLGGRSVLIIIFFVFGAFFWNYFNGISDNSKTLIRIETILQTMSEKIGDIKVVSNQNREKIKELRDWKLQQSVKASLP